MILSLLAGQCSSVFTSNLLTRSETDIYSSETKTSRTMTFTNYNEGLLGSNAALATNATIFGKDIIIDASSADLFNSGSIIASNNLTLNIGSLSSASINSGNLATTSLADIAKIKAGNDLTITANSLLLPIISSSDLSSNVATTFKGLPLGSSSSDITTTITTSEPTTYSGLNFQNTYLSSGGVTKLSSASNINISNDKNLKLATLSSLIPSLNNGDSGSTDGLLFAASIKDDAAAARSALTFNAGSDIELESAGSINIANNYTNSGGSIFLTATDNINNSNFQISAGENVVMQGNNVNNIATANNSNETKIEAGNIVSINAVKAACSGGDDGCSGGYKGGNITNIGATISGGSLVYLTADNNITNKALVQYNINGTNSYSSGLSSGQTAANFSNTTLDNDGISSSDTNVQSSSADHISSTLISQGNITSGGDLVLVAGNNLNNIGSNITSTGSSYLEATNGNINVTTSALRDRSLTRWGGSKKGGVSVTDNTTNIASNITSGSSGVGTLEFLATSDLTNGSSASGNINITGSNITSADNLTLTAQNDVNIQSAQNTTYSFSAGRSGRGKSYLNQSNSTTQIVSDLTTTNNGDITITSGYNNTDTVGATNSFGNLNIIASKLTTSDTDNNAANNVGSGDVNLTARNDLNISSAFNTKYSESFSSKKGLTIKKSSTTIDGSATNVSSEINTAGNITTSSGNDTNITASNLASQGSGSITSGGETNILNGVDSTTHYSNVVKEQKGILAQMPISSFVVKSFMMVNGGYYNGLSGGNLDKGNAIYGNSKNRIDATSTTEKIVTSNLNFANDLTISSDQNLAVRSSNLTSTFGDIVLTSNLGSVAITAAAANNSSNWLNSNKNDRLKATQEIVRNNSTVTSSEITSGQNIIITSAAGNVMLQAAKLTSGTANQAGDQDITVSAAHGNIYLLTASDSSEFSENSESKGTYSFSNGTSGQVNSVVINNEIRADGGGSSNTSGSITFATENQIIAQYRNTGSGSDTSVFADDAKLSYLSALDPSKTTFNPVEDQAIQWDQTTRGLTNTGTAVVAIAAVAATVASAGSAGVAVAGAAGATTAAAGATVTAASLTFGGAIIAASTAAIITTAAATAAVSATNASMNADGNFLGSLDDVGKTTIKDTTSDDALRSYAIAGITAGVTAGISQYAGIEQMSRVANATNTVDGTRTATQVIQSAKVSLIESAISNGTSSIVQSAVNGESTSDTLRHFAVNVGVGAVGNAAAKEIGAAAHPTDQYGNALTPKIGKITQYALHAGLGCATGAMQGGNCGAGAAAGVVGEIAGEYAFDNINQNTLNNTGTLTPSQIQQNRNLAIQIAGLAGSVASLFVSVGTGQSDEQTASNLFVGQRVGSNAAENNSLSDGIGVSPLDEEAQAYKDSKQQLDDRLKSIKTDLQTNLADTVVSSENKVTGGLAFGALVGVNILFPESFDEIGLGLISGGSTYGARSTTTLYRAVSQAELDDIAQYGLRSNPLGGSYDSGKLFATTAEDAVIFGRNNYIRYDQTPNTIVKIKVPNSAMASEGVYMFPADSMKAVSIYHDSGILSQVKAVPLNYSPIPKSQF